MGTGGAVQTKALNPVFQHLSPETQHNNFYVCVTMGTSEWGQVVKWIKGCRHEALPTAGVGGLEERKIFCNVFAKSSSQQDLT